MTFKDSFQTKVFYDSVLRRGLNTGLPIWIGASPARVGKITLMAITEPVVTGNAVCRKPGHGWGSGSESASRISVGMTRQRSGRVTEWESQIVRNCVSLSTARVR